MKRVLVIGSQGQVGSALCALLGPRAWGVDRAEVDLSSSASLRVFLDQRVAPAEIEAVINAAAYTQVDKAEQEPELAERVNGEAPGMLAAWCATHGLPFVHYSTDYVFSGEGADARAENAPVQPLNAYGRTKLHGEQRVAEAGGRYLVFRLCWVYDARGVNFLRTMLRLGGEREELRVVADQIGAPSYAPHLARASLQALEKARAMPEFPSGIYHLCHRGETSWHGFAEAIFAEARRKGIPLRVSRVSAIRTEEYPTPAQRPRNSRLDTSKAAKVLGVTLPDWKAGLAECMESYQ